MGWPNGCAAGVDPPPARPPSSPARVCEQGCSLLGVQQVRDEGRAPLVRARRGQAGERITDEAQGVTQAQRLDKGEGRGRSGGELLQHAAALPGRYRGLGANVHRRLEQHRAAGARPSGRPPVEEDEEDGEESGEAEGLDARRARLQMATQDLRAYVNAEDGLHGRARGGRGQRGLQGAQQAAGVAVLQRVLEDRPHRLVFDGRGIRRCDRVVGGARLHTGQHGVGADADRQQVEQRPGLAVASGPDLAAQVGGPAEGPAQQPVEVGLPLLGAHLQVGQCALDYGQRPAGQLRGPGAPARQAADFERAIHARRLAPGGGMRQHTARTSSSTDGAT